jgi:hypothetical protein
MMHKLVTMLSAGVAAVMLSGSAWAADATITPAQIEAAKTPADHEAIAAAYDKEAVRLESLAKQHEQMASAYGSAESKKGMDSAAMHAHCAKLARQYDDAAKENRALAAEHRMMASGAAH